jgi:spore maturation protein CgeB
VNLPQFGWGYSGRVFETMAAGVPAIAHRIPNRPRAAELFEENREILLYSTPAELAEQIRRLQTDRHFRRELTSRARRTTLDHHTTGHRVAQCLDWIQTGRQPQHRG